MMSQLGGGGPQTLFGYLLYHHATKQEDSRIGLAAGIGQDLPVSCRDWLLNNSIDISGVSMHGNACTPRAWQILEDDGRRHEIWRTEQSPTQSLMLLPPFESLPASRSFHLGIDAEDPPLTLLHMLHSKKKEYDEEDVSVSVETFKKSSRPLSKDQIAHAVKYCDIFSPNEAEAASILGIKNIPDSSEGHDDARARALTTAFVDAGAPLVALRRGARGAVIHERQQDKIWYIPAYNDIVVADTTGCGNAFCGAFLAALRDGVHPDVAASFGCAAGSIMAEHKGLPDTEPIHVFAELMYERMRTVYNKRRKSS